MKVQGNIIKYTKFDNLVDALQLQKQIKGRHNFEGYENNIAREAEFASAEYGFMVLTNGDIYSVFDTNSLKGRHKSFGEKLLNKINNINCLHDGSFYGCKIVKDENVISFFDTPLKRADITRKDSVENNYILTTDRVA